MTEGSPTAPTREPATTRPSERSSGRGFAAFLPAVGAVATALVVIALVVIMKPPSAAPDSPEAAFRNFVYAIQNNDYPTADDLLSARAQGAGITAELLLPHSGGAEWLAPSLGQPSVSGDSATMRASLTAKNGLLDNSLLWTGTITFVRESGAWKIDGVAPAPMWPPSPAPTV